MEIKRTVCSLDLLVESPIIINNWGQSKINLEPMQKASVAWVEY